jgi:rhodanese-related sulfurtransferase
MKALLAIAVLAAAAPSLAAEPPPRPAAPSVAPGVVDAQTARKLVAQGIQVVDVRTPKEYAAGHVPGAVNVPYDEIDKRHAELGPPSTPLLLYCQTGRRSGIAGLALRAKGFDKLYDLQKYELWVQSEPK